MGHLEGGQRFVGRDHRGLMSVVSQSPHFAYPQTVAQPHPPFGQLVDHLAAVNDLGHFVEEAPLPSRLFALAIGEHVEAQVRKTQEGIRAPAFAVEHDGEAAHRVGHQVADLRQQVLLHHRQQALGGRGGNHEQRLGPRVVDVEILRPWHRPAALLHVMLGQLVFVPVVDAHVTVQVEHAQRLGLGLYPALREALLERGRQAAQAHLVELGGAGS